ncbi:hypothetical protein AN639_00700 [Candidatus Epulonipiscium fishelsonii]|uniref:Uncharacterized protein n=1 Tax=Candidatus Epulonipiscium fishelsonii TaxID=77094 RepID=A0ACC8X7K2_9FIRM|nr:hypothetical protein AN396_12455 [Epulopiscium sp. SCG-B11WGA-EpuloA1]ONI41317.1 hypothetical protein AN639_00700 [Epulopiscium sp. SCG-B05WGA-EpuloA1]
MGEFIKNHKFLVGVCIVIIGAMIYNPNTSKDDIIILPKENELVEELNAKQLQDIDITSELSDNNIVDNSENIQQIPVYICGEINNTGVYWVNEHSLIQDVINMAGGVTSDADMTAINLAQILQPNSQVVVPKKGVILNTINTGQINNTGEDKININLADLVQLETLPNIGEVKAQAILDYREEHGSFSSLEQLKEVSGIGEKTYEGLKDSIRIN